MKLKLPNPGFELSLSNATPMTITVIPPVRVYLRFFFV